MTAQDFLCKALGEGAEREPVRAKPQLRVRVSGDLPRLATLTSGFAASSPGGRGFCTKNTSRALIERPYSCAPAVGAVYDRPGFFVQSRGRGTFVAVLPMPQVDRSVAFV